MSYIAIYNKLEKPGEFPSDSEDSALVIIALGKLNYFNEFQCFSLVSGEMLGVPPHTRQCFGGNGGRYALISVWLCKDAAV
jgi:hypothetical protein